MARFAIEIWGDMCPIPLIKAKKKLVSMRCDDILVLETEHSCTARGIVLWAQANRYIIEEEEVANGIWRLELTKTHN